MNPSTPNARWKDPEWQRTMRETCPVWQDSETGVWHVFRYEDAITVLSDYQTYGSDLSQVLPEQQRELTEGNILTMDPPRHHRLRSLVSRAFTPKAIARLEGRIAELTTELLKHTDGSEQIELVADLAYPLPVIVIAEMLGVPADDRPLFKSWADALLSQETTDPNDTAAFEQAAREMRKFHDYFSEHVRTRRRGPRDDLLSDLVSAEVDGQRLEDSEITGFAAILLLAGHITTTVLLGNAVRCLDAHPQAQENLRTHPDALPTAIEEVLRYTTPFAQTNRITTRETLLGDQLIPARHMVSVWTSSANRDHRKFARADHFVPDRTPNPHLGFGKGIHFCLGAPLARLETKIALGILLGHYSDLRVDPSYPLDPYADPGINGVKALHLQVKP